MPTLRLINKAIEAAVSARCFPIRGRKIFSDSAGDIFVKISLTTYNTEQGKNDGDFQKFLSYFPFSWGNTGVFQKRRIKQEIFSVGTKTQELFAQAVKSAKTVVWNGPMGVFENPTLAKGTIAVAKALADTDATTIIGGGDSAAAVIQLGFADKMSHISTGGGASLEYLEGKTLPGIAVIADK